MMNWRFKYEFFLNLMTMLCLLSASVFAAAGGISAYEFESEEQRQQFQKITQELRCPKCQNQSVGDSDAPIAVDIRDRVHEKILAGESQEQIIKFMTDRYGQFVTYRPPVSLATAVLWFGPPLLVVIVLLAVIKQTSRRQNVGGLNERELVEVEKILQDYGSASIDSEQTQGERRD